MAEINKIVLPNNEEYDIKDLSAIASTTTRNFTVSATAPNNPVNGDFWIDTTTSMPSIKMYQDNEWMLTGGSPLTETAKGSSSTTASTWHDLENITGLPYGTYEVSVSLAFQASATGGYIIDFGSGYRSFWTTNHYNNGEATCTSTSMPVVINASNPNIFMRFRSSTNGSILNYYFTYRKIC